MFFEKEDEEQDFLNPKSSKLGALFGMDRAESKGGNESLTYTAPKQPKKKESTPPAKGGGPAVTFAVAVHAYKYVDNKYVSQGKLGAAILANHVSSEYSILMYVTQQQKITTAKISPAFPFTTQPNKYAQFYDDARQSWSILFETEQNAADFAKHVCLAKALCGGPSPSSLVTQDLSGGEGGELQVGDSVEVKYTGWLLTNNTIGQVFDSNTSADKLFRFKIGAGKVIKGWDAGVLGMKKGGKRFLVVPSTMAYGSQGMANRVPANATLLFEVEVVRVKLVGRESSPSPAPAPVQPAPEPATEEEEEIDGQSVKGRTRSITEIAHSPPGDSGKAKLISRMAKMGKPMLPFSGATVAGPESDEEHVPESPKPVSESPSHDAGVHKPVARSAAPVQQQQQQQQPVLQQQQQQQPQQQPMYQPAMSQPQPAFLQNLPGAQQMAVYQPQSQQSFVQQQMMQQQPGGFQSPMYPGAVSSQGQPVTGSSLPQYLLPGMPQGQSDVMLLSETRQQNTEMRLSLSKVADKVDQVLSKVETLNSQASSTAMLPNMETSVLLHNITRVVQENERLKKDVFDKSAKIESMNDKISGLLQQNQSYVEKSQVLMEQRNEGLLTSANQVQGKVLALEQEKVGLTQRLGEASSQISSLQLEVTSLKKREFELSQQLDIGTRDTRKAGEELETLRTQHAEDESRISELQRLLREEKQGRKSVDTTLAQLQEELADLRDTKQLLEKSMSERKKKAVEERRRLEEEMEDLKINLEADIQSLKDKLRKMKTSASTASQEQLSRIEEEIHADWQEKCDKLLAAAADKHARALREVREEKVELESALQEMEKKLAMARSSSSGTDQKVAQLQEELEELAQWKDKYTSLRASAGSMKERYEARIEELEEEKSQADTLIHQLRADLKAGAGVAGSTTVATTADSASLLDEVKKIMNSVYKEMREVFEADESYTGTEILTVILNSIKSTTMALMRKQKSVEDQDDDNEEEEEEEESDEEEEEEEEEESEEEEEEEEEEQISNKGAGDTVGAEVKVGEDSGEAQTQAAEPSSHTDNSSTPGVEQDIVGANNSQDSVVDTAADSDGAKHTTSDTHTLADSQQQEPKVAETNTEETEQTEQIENEEPTPVPPEVPDLLAAEPEPVLPTTTTQAGEGEFSLRKADSLDDMLDSALDKPAAAAGKVGSAGAAPLVSTEPPPLMDGESSEEEKEEEEQAEKDRTKSIFNDDDDDDDNVADTLGFSSSSSSKAVVNGDQKKPAIVEEDLKPKPPPPLFGDDDDDDDLDWLS